ncbi:MAG: hypothetical protein ACTSQ8_24115, partial [Candidatus Helarchaeota archaeon]
MPRRDDEEGETFFTEGIDWVNAPDKDSTIIWTGTGDLPKDGTEFDVYYEFTFNFENKNYGLIQLGGNESKRRSKNGAITLDIPKLPLSEKMRQPLYLEYEIIGNGSASYVIPYTFSDTADPWADGSIILNNETELSKQYSIIKNVNDDGYPVITFEGGLPYNKHFSIGLHSGYKLGYGFQTKGGLKSRSIRQIYNNENKDIITSSGIIEPYELNNPALYIGLDKQYDTTLQLYSIPLLYAPEVRMDFVFDEYLMSLLKDRGSEMKDLKIKFSYVISGEYENSYTDSILIPVDEI